MCSERTSRITWTDADGVELPRSYEIKSDLIIGHGFGGKRHILKNPEPGNRVTRVTCPHSIPS